MEALIRGAAMAEGSVRLPRRTATPQSQPVLANTAAPAGAATLAARSPDVAISTAPDTSAHVTVATPQAVPPTPAEITELRQQLEHEFAQRRAQLEAEFSAAMTKLDESADAMHDEAARSGHAEGLARGEEDGRKELEQQVARCAQVASQLAKCRTQMAEQSEDMLVELAFAAVVRLLGEHAATPEGVRGAVQAAMAAVNDGETLTISVHPDDLALLQGHTAFDQERLRLVADLGIDLGGCTVEGAKGTLDARLDMQMDRLRDTLLAVRAARAQAGEAV